MEDLRLTVDERTELLLPREEDAEEAFRLIDRDRARLEPFMEWVFGLKTVEEEREFIRGRLAHHAVGSGVQTFIWRDGRIAGSIGTVVVDRENDAAEVGYLVFAEHEGTGLAFASTRAFIDHLFQVEGIHRIVIRVMPENTRSRNLAMRLGFTFEGIQRETYRLRGRYRDLEIYSLLSHEWGHGVPKER